MAIKRFGWIRSEEKAVERRREPRFRVDMPVIVTVLGTAGRLLIPGYMEDISGSGLRFRLPLPIDCGMRVKVAGEGILLLGEIRCSQPTEDGYQVVMEISCALAPLSDLERFHRGVV